MNHQLKIDQRAFTIVELMIATMVFSVILLLVTTGVIQIGSAYYKGALQSRTQETARNIIDEISRGIQFSGDRVVINTGYDVAANPYPQPGGRYGLCVGGTAYSYIIDRQLRDPNGPPGTTDQRPYMLMSYRPTEGCSTYPTGADVGSNPIYAPASVNTQYPNAYKELLGIGMRLTALQIQDNGNNTYTITVEVASGERELFEPADTNLISTACRGSVGNQFCAMSRLTTTVQKRVK